MPYGTINSTDKHLVAASTKLNDNYLLKQVMRGRAAVARFVNRDDIPHPPAPAWYLPDTADIYIHVDEAGINPINLTVPSGDTHQWTGPAFDGNFDIAKSLGLLAHEGSHAAISDHIERLWDEAPHHRTLLTMFEELRVENHAIRWVPDCRKFLRASFTIILAGIGDNDIDNTALVAHGWALVRGRTLAGIATPVETEPIDTAARTLLGDDVVDDLTDLLQEALTLNLGDSWHRRRMIKICDEWVELVGADGMDESCAACDADGSGAKGSPRPGVPGKSTKGDDESGDDKGADAANADNGEDEGDEGTAGGTGAADEPADQPPTEGDADSLGSPGVTPVDNHGERNAPQPISEEAQELAQDTIKDLSDEMHDQWMNPAPHGIRANSAEWSSRIFGNSKEYRSLSTREPSLKNRQDVAKVAAVLSNLALPAIGKTARPSVLPPGRLRSREMVRASAERAQGQMVTAKPWRGTVRRHSSARPLVVGIATDTSGSMGWAENAVADFAFVYANAGHRIGARTAAVTFGSSVRRIARPGEVMTNVVVKSASDSEEQCDYALAALDGVLHLTKPSPAARILLVVSDGALVRDGETAKVSEWLRLMDTVGTHIVWITDHQPDSDYWLAGLAHELDTMTVVGAKASSRRRGHVMSFDEVNAAALEAITKYIR